VEDGEEEEEEEEIPQEGEGGSSCVLQ
jgi:hypothetical protein